MSFTARLAETVDSRIEVQIEDGSAQGAAAGTAEENGQ